MKYSLPMIGDQAGKWVVPTDHRSAATGQSDDEEVLVDELDDESEVDELDDESELEDVLDDASLDDDSEDDALPLDRDPALDPWSFL